MLDSRKLPVVLRGFAAGLLVLGAGCTRDEATSTDGVDLESSYAGLTFEDEADGYFGEEDIYEELGENPEDQALDDVPLEDPPASGGPVYHALILWGQLAFNPDAPIRDFSGALGMDEGSVRVLRAVRFEPGDRVIERGGDTAVEFVSVIRPHHDGLLLRIVAPAGAALHMVTESYVGEFPVEEGARVEEVDESGTRVAVVMLRADGGVCRRGIMGGRWHGVEPDRELGLFRGRWMAAGGALHGRLRGIYGQRSGGDRVFFGKAVNSEGRFLALLAGRYGQGEYRGRWLGRNREHLGGLRGRYVETVPGDVDGGFFLGFWREYCGEDGASSDEPSVE